jgi:P pilus assembly chaperone PapD
VRIKQSCVQLLGGVALFALPAPVGAELVVSDLVIELNSDTQPRKDVEVWNNSDERYYVEVTSSEILDPGSPSEKRVREPNPEKLGLLVSPSRLILEPAQRKVVRIARIAPLLDRERVYRITIKPVVGEVTSDQSGLKVLVGYDVLTIVRPNKPAPRVSGSRNGNRLTVHNYGNSSVELINGRQCDSTKHCIDLPGKRLYAGASWGQELPGIGPVEYTVKGPGQSASTRF